MRHEVRNIDVIGKIKQISDNPQRYSGQGALKAQKHLNIRDIGARGAGNQQIARRL